MFGKIQLISTRNLKRREISLHSKLKALIRTKLYLSKIGLQGLDHHDYGTLDMTKIFNKDERDSIVTKKFHHSRFHIFFESIMKMMIH